MTDKSHMIEGFCEAESISRSMLYRLWKQGKGPRFFNVGNSRRISEEAGTEWRRAREAEADCFEKIGDAAARVVSKLRTGLMAGVRAAGTAVDQSLRWQFPVLKISAATNENAH